MAQAREVVPVMDAKVTPKRSKSGAAGTSGRKGLGGPYGASFTGEGTRGLTFERRWTRPGVHPYDEIAWEYRTAGISSESGKTVFEQKDVEVPVSWSQLATNVVVSKYFRGHVGTPEREHSIRQLIDRVVNTIAAWAETNRYFATDEDLAAFKAELTHLLVHQKMAFNSPVWFNVGIEERPQCSACFINSVQDNMSSIMDLAKTEAMLFKYGSGAGVNLSPIRSSKARMSGGGIASGPVSFMRGYDAFAGVIKSGGKTRRAAKMVILDVDHPDVLDFIDSKAREEQKAWALIEQGYDPSFTGEAYGSVFFQNANHSVRVTDEFMRAVERDAEWQTHEVSDGQPAGTYKARDIFRKMAEAAHLCGDPGIQYDTTINDWHTSANTDRIYASNPCSEYMFLNDTACNLASLNLMKFVREDGEFDVDAFRFAAKVTITAQEILVDHASYPTVRIEENSHRFRPLGLGYANLGALLMNRGLAYDSDQGRNYAAAITALMHGEAYRQSSVIARDHGGPFVDYDQNRDPFLRVIRKHRDASYRIATDGVPAEMLDNVHQPLRRGRGAGRGQRLPQRPGDRAGPHRDHRVHDGLRHHRHRAGHRADQVQEAGRRGLPQDRQPDRPGGAPQARLHAGAGRGDPRLRQRAGDHRGRPGPQPGAPVGLRLRVQARQRRAVHPLHGPRPDDGRGAAVPLRRHQQDRQHARGRHAPRRSRPSTSRAGSRASRPSRSTATARSAASR